MKLAFSRFQVDSHSIVIEELDLLHLEKPILDLIFLALGWKEPAEESGNAVPAVLHQIAILGEVGQNPLSHVGRDGPGAEAGLVDEVLVDDDLSVVVQRFAFKRVHDRPHNVIRIPRSRRWSPLVTSW